MERALRILPSDLSFLAPVETDHLIRVGNEHDGGYVIPESAVKDVDILLSFGVNTDWSFEESFKDLNNGVEIHAYDHTVGERRFARDYRRGIVKWLLRRTSLSDVRHRQEVLRSYKSFFPSHATHFEEAIHARNRKPGHATLDKVFSRTTSQRVFLKVDIEGTEYSIIDDILRYAPRIRGIAIEFHETQALRETFRSAVERLLTQFHIVHFHGNNLNHAAPDGLPNVVEITFAKGPPPRDAAHRSSLPIPGLDSPNNPRSPDHPIRFTERCGDAVDNRRETLQSESGDDIRH